MGGNKRSLTLQPPVKMESPEMPYWVSLAIGSNPNLLVVILSPGDANVVADELKIPATSAAKPSPKLCPVQIIVKFLGR